jgi:RNA 2',3'-cyclic 3'-phosphodiesterase
MNQPDPGRDIATAGGEPRWFAALTPGTAVREALMEATAALRPAADRAGARVAWLAPEDLHVTLVFLGPCPADRRAAVEAALARTAADAAPFTLRARGLGCFGTPRRPRVLWAGVDGAEDPLAWLQCRCVRELAAEGFRLDGRAYRPHITVGRVRAVRNASPLTEGLHRLQDGVFGAWPVRDIRLMRSLPPGAGRRYRTEGRWILKTTNEPNQGA